MPYNIPVRVTLTDVGLLLIRLVLAVVFLYHGGQKLLGLFGGPGLSGTAAGFTKMGFPLPTASACAAAGTEFFGAVILLLGGGPLGRCAALLMAFTMAVAVGAVHRSAFDARSGGMEYPLTLGVVLLALALTGLGQLTLPNLIRSGGRTDKPVPEGFELAKD